MTEDDWRSRSTREVYVGNFTYGRVHATILTKAFEHLFSLLPEYLERYADLSSPVVRTRFVEAQRCAFVEFADEVLSSTAILMDKFVLFGRRIVVGRTHKYENPRQEVPGLDVTPLRKVYAIPCSSDFLGISQRLRRQVYIGNLPKMVSPDTLLEFLTPICKSFREFARSLGSQ